MKTFFKRLLLILGLFIGLLLLALVAITSLFQDQIGDRVTTELNSQLKGELKIDGFELSFLRSFPNIGANLQGVSLDGTDGKPLLEAGELSFQAGLLSLLGSNIKLQSVVVRDGGLKIHTKRNGKNNYDIFQEEDNSESAPSSGAIDLKKASVINMDIHYIDEQSKQDIRLFVEEANFTGQFSSDNYELDSDAELMLTYISMDGEQLLSNQSLAYQTKLDVNTATATYGIEQLDIQLGQLPVNSNGQFQLLEEKIVLAINFQSDDGELEDLIGLLPYQYKGYFKEIETRGTFSLDGSVNGEYSERSMPKIKTKLDFSNGRITGDRIDARVRELGFSAIYSNGERQNAATSSLALENLQGEIDGDPFALDLSVANFDEPNVDFSANGTLAPGLMAGFIPDERISEGSGKIYLNHLRIKGRYKDMLSVSRADRVEMSGQMSFDEAGFVINDELVQLSEGQFNLSGNELSVKQLVLEAPDTRMQFDGQAANILPVLFSDSLNSKDVSLNFDAKLQVDELDMDQLMALGAPSEEAIVAAEAAGQSDSLAIAEVEKREFITQFLEGTFQASIEDFNYGQLEGKDFRGTLKFSDGTMIIQGQTHAMQGTLVLDGEMIFDATPTLTAKISCDRVSAYEFFRQSENFGQEVLVADNLEGRLNARFYVEAFFDEEGNFLTDQLQVLGGIGIKDGRLKDFKMLEDFSTFVNIRDLQEIRFTNLENFFEVRNSKLYLPVMFIQSNALNMTISGEHTFDQDISYYIKVNAGQVMADRFRRHNPKLNPKRARKNGFFNLYYAILGDIDNFNFVSDKRRVLNDFEESDRRKRDIHYQLERKFGTVIELVQEPQDWRDIPEYEEDPNSDEPEFLDMEIDGGGGKK